MPNSFGQSDTQIPDWIKDVALWWADNQISENYARISFLAGKQQERTRSLEEENYQLKNKRNYRKILLKRYQS